MKKPKHIFVIKTVKEEPIGPNWVTTVGYTFTKKGAKCIVKHNIEDIAECGYYKYGVIIKVTPGTYQFGEQTWYEFTYNGVDDRDIPVFHKAKLIVTPEKFENFLLGI